MKTKATRKRVAQMPEPEYAGSAINLRKADWRMLRRVAEARAETHGGRPSVSKVIESLIDQNRRQLEAEGGKS